MIEIMEGIGIALDHIFSDNSICAEETEQKMEKHNFLITPLLSMQKDFLSGRKKEERSYMIQYAPLDSPNSIEECVRTGERIMENLDVIETDHGMIRCTNKQYEIIDGILHFTVNCNRIVRKKEAEKEKMQQAAIEGIYAK